jgi:hypothetical protein
MVKVIQNETLPEKIITKVNYRFAQLLYWNLNFNSSSKLIR